MPSLWADHSSLITAVKVAHMGTADDCARQGVKCQLMVVESTGAWDNQATRVLQDFRLSATRAMPWRPLVGSPDFLLCLHRRRSLPVCTEDGAVLSGAEAL